jgi:type II secretory ATPase GspE/PulE/Tfp pilus assembly ATPase PilB-like protein
MSEYDIDLNNITLWKEKPSEGSPFGFNGRTAIMEQLVVTEPIQKYIRGDVADINTNEIEKTARAEGMLTLEQKGVLAALRGDTTIDEIGRVI